MKANTPPPWRRFLATVSSPFRHAVSLLRDVASQADLSIDDQARWNEAIGGLLVAVIRADHQETPEEVALVEEIFTLQFGKREAQRVKDIVQNGAARPINDLCETLKGLSAQDRAEMIRAMLEMAAADDRISQDELTVIRAASRGFGFDEECVDRFHKDLLTEREKRSAIVKSGAGIAVALAVIGVFVFTATFLKSVLFGLILAYLCWPLQRFFQHRFFPHPWIQQAQRVVSKIGWPIRYVVDKLKALFATGHGEHAEDESHRRVAQACHATLVTVVAGAALGIALFVWVSSGYVARVGRFVADSQSARVEKAPRTKSTESNAVSPTRTVDPSSHASETPSAESTEPKDSGVSPSDANSKDSDESSRERQSTDDQDRIAAVSDGPILTPDENAEPNMEHGILEEGLPWLERFRPLLKRSTLLKTATEAAEQYLTDEQKKKELAIAVFQNLQPVLIRAGGFAATVGSFLLDILMTMFFFTFFLQRIASGQSREGGHRRQTGQYLVEAIFDSGWLPSPSPAARREGQLIIDDILSMLKTWLRGYLWIIVIDTALYTAIFMALGIPYSPVLGLLAGLTILLPFIGPIVSCSLTLLVTFALHSQSITLMVTIVLCYLVIHGIVEQLILFPALVGEALGLNSLETIIIVLLGGLVSGLAGAVFAVPVAAILKYLIPKIYQAYWRPAAGADAVPVESS